MKDINNKKNKHAEVKSNKFFIRKSKDEPTANQVKNEFESPKGEKRHPIKEQKIKSKNPPKIVDLEKKKKRRKKINIIFLILYLIFSIYVIISYFSWKSLILPMMKNEHSVVIDKNGNIVETLGAEKKQSNVQLSEVPQNLKNAYIDIEDERFYKHKGVDTKRTVAAIGSYIIHGGKSSFGGSTITQQLVKNLTGDDDNSISRTVSEWGTSVSLETFCDKDEILETYLNIIYIAPNTYGVKTGAKYYFNKELNDLSLAECAFLAGINNSPNSYNPFKENVNTEKIKNRTKAVLTKMLEQKDITKDEYESAVQELEKGLNFNNGKVETDGTGIYSYHTDAVISEVISEIANKKNIDTKFATNYVYMSGMKIYSTEDSEIQKKLEDEYNKSKYVLTSSTGNKSQSAMVIMDQSNGQVVACVGGLGEKNTSRGFNRATQAVRQTGSAIKSIAVLAPGIDQKKFSAATIYADEPTTFNKGTSEEYSPTDNDDYIGEITVRRAVESSQNIPFVKMMEDVTPKTSIKYLKKMGITSLTKNDEKLGLALGGLEKGITPLEMAAAYATIANDGEYIEPTFYTKVDGADGKTIIKTKQKTTKVFSKEVAYVLKELLKQPVEGSDGTARSCKIDGLDVAAKTGTTNDNYDKWLCGFTTYYTAVTWYGYDISETISYKGKSPAALLWSSVMKSVHKDLENTKFVKQGNVKEATICSKTGHVANENCQNTYTEYFISGTIPSKCVGCNSSSRNNTTTNKTNNNEKKNETNKVNTTTNTEDQNITNKTTNTTVNNNINNKLDNNVVKNNTSKNNNVTSNKTNDIENNTIDNKTNTNKNNTTVNNSTNKNNTEDEDHTNKNPHENNNDNEDDSEEDDGP